MCVSHETILLIYFLLLTNTLHYKIWFVALGNYTKLKKYKWENIIISGLYSGLLIKVI